MSIVPTLVRRRLVAAMAALSLASASCAFGPQDTESGPPTETVYLNIVDERGAPVTDAEVELIDTHGWPRITEHRTDHDGVARLSLSDPVVAVVTAEGRLDEPVVVGPDDNGLTITLWDRVDAEGRSRVSMHFGGDVMLGRRYLDPNRPTAWAHDQVSARRLVRHLAPLSRRADWTVVNLETVLGDLPDDLALTAKRFLLQSAPFTTDALDELGVDVVALGNNHAYDWGDEGLVATFDLLDGAGIGHVGAGFTREEAIRGRLDDVGGVTVGTISVTTVNGDYVNDRLPDGADPVPEELTETDAWLYEPRRFGFTGHGVTIPVAERRIGDAWRRFTAVEDELGPAITGQLWAALTEVYPELQDWVARRGHGGAAPYRAEDVDDEITRLRSEGADLVVLQLHGGFQFAEVASTFVRQVTHRAIDAGADIVVGHHPHVLQGVEWYGDGLIVHSLGNLVFDQDFLSTFSSALLRVVTDGEQILEARILPVMVDRYRPKPVAGRSADSILRLIDERTALSAVSERVDGARVGAVIADLDRSATSIRREGNTGVIERDRHTERWHAVLDAGEVVDLPECALVRSDLLADGVTLGVDRLGWGHFDHDAVRGVTRSDDGPDRRLPLAWRVPGDAARWSITAGSTRALSDRALRIETDPNTTSTIWLLANLDLAGHRHFDPDGSTLDASAELQVVMSVRRDRSEPPVLRFVTFAFDDTDPTTAPTTERLRTVELAIDVPDDGRWHEVVLDLPAELLEPDAEGRVANKANLLVDAPPAVLGIVDLDDVRVVEWRGRTGSEIPVWVAADLVRAESSGRIELTMSSC
ncbi:MAG TPA: CapA family protein [Ilumatobacter sp.]|nr:CapA family protein [Ilumatobacter sp.]